jgi:hypothetical protein
VPVAEELLYLDDNDAIVEQHRVSAVSADGQACSMTATLEGQRTSKNHEDQARARTVSSGHQVRRPDRDETRCLRGPGTGKGKKSGVAVVFAPGVFDTGAGQIAGAAFVVDACIEEHYKGMVRQICQTIRVADQFAEKK